MAMKRMIVLLLMVVTWAAVIPFAMHYWYRRPKLRPSLSQFGRLPRIVATMSTTASAERMQCLKRSIESLANQSVTLDRIILNVPKFLKRRNVSVELPPALAAWAAERSPQLVVRRVDDHGPATKLLGALEVEEEPDTVLIVVDDDVRYHQYTVETLVHAMLSSPVDIAPSFAGEECCGADRHYFSGIGPYKGYPSAYAGVAYRVRYFDKRVWDNEAAGVPRGCFYHDDVWIGGSLLKNAGIRPFRVDSDINSVLEHGVAGSHTSDSINAANHQFVKNGKDVQRDCELHFNDFC